MTGERGGAGTGIPGRTRPLKDTLPMLQAIADLWRDQDGLATVEYALLLVLLVVGTVGAWVNLRETLNGVVGDIVVAVR